jgi:hypothetical protein
MGSPKELKVTVIVVPTVTPDGSLPDGSRLLVDGTVAGNVYVDWPDTKAMLFETRFAMAHSWTYRMSEAII